MWNFSVLGLQSDSPALGVQIKIRILAVFFNQRYESGPKATISTWFLSGYHHVKWRAVRLS